MLYPHVAAVLVQELRGTPQELAMLHTLLSERQVLRLRCSNGKARSCVVGDLDPWTETLRMLRVCPSAFQLARTGEVQRGTALRHRVGFAASRFRAQHPWLLLPDSLACDDVIDDREDRC